MADDTTTPEPDDDHIDIPEPEETVEAQGPTKAVPQMSAEELREKFLNDHDVPHTDISQPPAGPVKEKPAYERGAKLPEMPSEIAEQMQPDGTYPVNILEEWALLNKVDDVLERAKAQLGDRGYAVLRERVVEAIPHVVELVMPDRKHECEEDCSEKTVCDGDCDCDCDDTIVEKVVDRWPRLKKYAAVIVAVIGGLIGGSAGTVAVQEVTTPPAIEDPVVGPELPDRDAALASLYFELCKHGHPLTTDEDGNVSFTIHKMSVEGNRGYDATFRATKNGHLNVTLKR